MIRARTKPVIGLAGGIGAGKSTVARLLESLGAAVIDSDRLSHEELASADVAATLRDWWGDAVFNPAGAVDRSKVAAIVFNDRAELTRLEGLLYPRIRRRQEALLRSFGGDPKVKAIVLDSPKLFEAGLNELCDTVIFVEADDAVRVRRVCQTRGWTEEELHRRENLFNPLDQKRANADHAIINHSSIEALRSHVEKVFLAVLASFAKALSTTYRASTDFIDSVGLLNQFRKPFTPG